MASVKKSAEMFKLEDRVLFDAAAVAEIVEAEAVVENPDPEANQSETDRQAQEDRNALKNAGPADDGAGGAPKADEDGPVVTAAVADIDARDRALIEGVMANNATNEIEDEGLRRLHADPPFIDLQDEYDTIEDVIERERRAAEDARLRGEDSQPTSMEFSDRFLAEYQRRADELRVDLGSREAEKEKPETSVVVPPAKGSVDDPWQIGATTNDDVRAYTNGTTLVIEGSGAMRSWVLDTAPWSGLAGSIASISIEEGVTQVGDLSFWGCSCLGEAMIPASVTNIGNLAFGLCTSLSNVTFAADSQLAEIGGFAFCQADVSEIAIPASVTSIGDFAFAICTSLVNVAFGVDSRLKFIGDSAFFSCPSVVQLEVPAGVVNCGAGAFVDTPNVTVNPGNGTFAIVNGLFCDIQSMKVVSGLAAADVTIPESMEIGGFAFDGSRDLCFVEIPASVTNIGESAFLECRQLTDVLVLAIKPPALGTNAFDYCGEDVGEGFEIHVPACMGATYKAAAGWSAYADKIVELSFVPVSLDDVLFCNAAEVATNVAKAAVFVPSAEVAAKLGTGTTAISNYCASFSFAIIGVADDGWAVMAALRPKAWTNVVKSAQMATRQIPLADIAALPTEGKKDVTVTGCVPGFYYTLRGSGSLEGLGSLEGADVYGPELCGAEGEVTFPEVEKPSDAAGFFSIEARAVRE